MTCTISLWVAMVMLGPGPDQGLVQPDANVFPQLACYCPSARKFIKEEKEKLSTDEHETDDTKALHDSYNLERFSELLDKFFYIIKTLFKPDENPNLVTRRGSPGNHGRLP